MEILIIIVICIIALVVYGVHTASKNEKFMTETIERRKKYVESISPNAKIIVNNGIHLFFKDDERQFFGLDETGKTYSFGGLHHISTYKDGIGFFHKESVSLCVGKDYSRQDSTFSLDSGSVAAIADEMLPILRRNLHNKLFEEGISPTHEYEHRGEIWGCDIKSKKFFNTAGSFNIYNFSDLLRVTVEDLTNNTLYDGKFIIHVFAKSYFEWDDDEFEIHFKDKDSTFFNLLAMFKGIRNRQD